MRPFLKWAGGKSRLVPRIAAMLPVRPGRLIEPFLGSGAVFLGVGRRYGGAVLGDANPDLITLYTRLVAERDALIAEVERLFRPETNTRAAFEELRARFNALPAGDPARAPLLVYLNRHAFNGLHRVNRAGGFNVPFGGYVRPVPPSAEMRAFAAAASAARFLRADFREVMGLARPGDVVYCDPPYSPLSPTARFDAYAAGGFSADDHAALAALCRDLAAAGIPVLVSNHDTAFTRALYAGAEILPLHVRRSISGSPAARGRAPELLVLFHAAGSAEEADFHARRASGEASPGEASPGEASPGEAEEGRGMDLAA